MTFPEYFPFYLGGDPPGIVDVDPPPGATTFADPFVPALTYTDHVEQGISKLLYQFQGQPKIEALLRGWLVRIQELENTFWALKLLTGVFNSTGQALDRIGQIAGEPDRAGDVDDIYRIRILVRIAVNLSNGKRSDLVGVLKAVLGNDVSYGVREFYPASSHYTLNAEPLGFSALDVFEMLYASKVAGVRLHLTFVTAPIEETFVLDTFYPPDVTVPGQYAGTFYDSSLGGLCASVYSR